MRIEILVFVLVMALLVASWIGMWKLTVLLWHNPMIIAWGYVGSVVLSWAFKPRIDHG